MAQQLTRAAQAISRTRSQVKTLSANTTLSPADLPGLVKVTGTATVVITLPLAALCKGASITLVGVAATAAGAGLTLDVNAADTMNGNGFTAAAGKGAVNSQATSRAGDTITAVSDGGTAWYITAVTGTWAREA